jgi:hypothetical protein
MSPAEVLSELLRQADAIETAAVAALDAATDDAAFIEAEKRFDEECAAADRLIALARGVIDPRKQLQ